MPTIFMAMDVAGIAPWSKFDCLGGCCTYLPWLSVSDMSLCAQYAGRPRGLLLEPYELADLL